MYSTLEVHEVPSAGHKPHCTASATFTGTSRGSFRLAITYASYSVRLGQLGRAGLRVAIVSLSRLSFSFITSSVNGRIWPLDMKKIPTISPAERPSLSSFLAAFRVETRSPRSEERRVGKECRSRWS